MTFSMGSRQHWLSPASALVAVGLLAGCAVVGPDGDASGGDASAAVPTAPSMSVAPEPSPDPQVSAIDSDVDAQVIEHAASRYLVVTLPLDQWDVRIDWDPDDDGVMLADVIESDPAIAVATNAGIFTPELVPGGLLVSDGEQRVALNLADGGGNFHLMPNGVFALYDDGTAAVMNSVEYSDAGVEFATQSGPALILGGEVHPEFNEGSTNLAYRSGVGVSSDGETVYLAMSWTLTNLYDFATLFRDELDVGDALYLDGDISDLWVDELPAPSFLAGPYAGVITARPKG